MAVKIDIKHNNVAGVVPTTSSINLNEIAFNTVDGKAYFKQNNGISSIKEFITTSHTGSFKISGSLTVNDVITLSPQNPLPLGQPTGSLAVSGSGASCQIYFFNGTWNALFTV